MELKRVIPLLAVFVGSLALACGGDGPSPLAVTIGTNLVQMPTQGEVQEFQVWENKRTLVYRNQHGEVLSMNTINGASTRLTRTRQPLMHFAAPQERFLLTEIGSWFFDVLGKRQWIQYNQNVPSMEPIFWDHNDMYAVASTYNLSGQQWLRIFRYHAGDDYVLPLCSDFHFDAGHGYQIVRGHEFPKLFLYQTTPTVMGEQVSLYTLDVLNCDLTSVPSFQHTVDGTVESVYHFAGAGATAVKIDHPTRNWMWATAGGSCLFHDIGTLTPIQVNQDLPVIATWSPKQNGLTLYDFSRATTQVAMTTVLNTASTPLSHVGHNDLYLTSDGKELFAKPLLNRERDARPVLKVSLRGIPFR
jgi:hypothetical protein